MHSTPYYGEFMKSINARRSFIRFAALLMLAALLPALSTYAQSGVNNYKEETARVQYSSDDLESLRADLIAFVRAYQGMARTVNPNLAGKFNGIEGQLKKLSATQLNILRNGLPDVSILSKSTRKLNLAVEKSNLNRSVNFAQKNGSALDNAVGFPDADYPSCGSTRTDDAVVDASDTALFVAEGIRDAASRACDEVIVILGEGGNGSLACLITDGIYVAAKIINYGLHYCNDKIDSAEQQANFNRLGHLHTDLENSIINDNTNTTTITGAVTTAKNTIVSNSDTNRNTIVVNDNLNKTTIVTAISNSQGAIVDNANGNTAALTTAISNTQSAIINNDNTNKTTIVNNDNANKNTIVDNANANATMLSNLLLRTQIESDLAAGDTSTPVGLFQTPGTICSAAAPLNQCGMIGLVRLIVVQTISNQAGSSTSQANSFLAKGDKDLAAGNYKSAYQWYRQAYKTAVK
jgi:hypothetical protein